MGVPFHISTPRDNGHFTLGANLGHFWHGNVEPIAFRASIWTVPCWKTCQSMEIFKGGGCGYDIIYIILERAFSLISYNFCISTSFLSIETTTFVICSCYENLNNSQFHWKANHMGVESSYHYELTRVYNRVLFEALVYIYIHKGHVLFCLVCTSKKVVKKIEAYVHVHKGIFRLREQVNNRCVISSGWHVY